MHSFFVISFLYKRKRNYLLHERTLWKMRRDKGVILGQIIYYLPFFFKSAISNVIVSNRNKTIALSGYCLSPTRKYSWPHLIDVTINYLLFYTIQKEFKCLEIKQKYKFHTNKILEIRHNSNMIIKFMAKSCNASIPDHK